MIPKNVFFTHETDGHLKGYEKIINHNKNLNPDFKFYFYDAEDRINFINENFPEYLKYYLKINPIYGASRADFFRYLIIYKYGGVYIDHKCKINVKLEKIMQNYDFVVSYGEKNLFYKYLKKMTYCYKNSEIDQFCFMATPKHSLLKKIIDEMINRIKNFNKNKEGPSFVERIYNRNFIFGTYKKGYLATFLTTGPLLFTEIIEKKKKKYKNIKIYDYIFENMISYRVGLLSDGILYIIYYFIILYWFGEENYKNTRKNIIL